MKHYSETRETDLVSEEQRTRYRVIGETTKTIGTIGQSFRPDASCMKTEDRKWYAKTFSSAIGLYGNGYGTGKKDVRSSRDLNNPDS